LAYYCDRLGFEVAFVWGKPTTFYGGVCSGKGTLHLIAGDRTPRQPGHGAVAIEVDDVDALHGALVKRGAKVLKAPANYGYGLRGVDVSEPDGNMLFFGMELKQSS